MHNIQLSEDQIENIKNVLRDLDLTSSDSSIIQDNKIYFLHGDKSFMCQMPSQRQQVEAEDEKDTYKIKLVTEGKFPTRNQLKKILKEKQDIDIDAMEKERIAIRDEIRVQMLRGASILSTEEEALKKQEQVLADLQTKLIDKLYEMEECLSTCLESKVMSRYYRYLTYLVTYVRGTNGEYVRAWDSFEDFEKDQSVVTYKAIKASQSLLLNTKD